MLHVRRVTTDRAGKKIRSAQLLRVLFMKRCHPAVDARAQPIHFRAVTCLTPDILVVDDEDDVREVAVYALREAGFEVADTVNADVALILIEQGLKPRLLFTDIVMPGERDGVALARDAKLLVPDLRVIYATGFMGFARARSGSELEGEVLQKPYSPSSLLEMVRRLLPGRVEN
jgi:DNA-binding NtrC family response regulator